MKAYESISSNRNKEIWIIVLSSLTPMSKKPALKSPSHIPLACFSQSTKQQKHHQKPNQPSPKAIHPCFPNRHPGIVQARPGLPHVGGLHRARAAGEAPQQPKQRRRAGLRGAAEPGRAAGFADAHFLCGGDICGYLCAGQGEGRSNDGHFVVFACFCVCLKILNVRAKMILSSISPILKTLDYHES